MSTDIEAKLREHESTVMLHRSVDDVLRRGDQLRRRRTAGMLAAGAVAAVALLAGSIALPPGSSPVVGRAVASWSGGSTNLTPGELRAISHVCLTQQPAGPIGPVPPGTMPIAAESRNDTFIAYFRNGATELTCLTTRRPDGSMRLTTLSATDYAPLSRGADLGDDTGFGYRDPGVMGGPIADAYAADEVSRRVARVTAQVGSKTYEGTILDGVVLFWVTHPDSRRHVDNAIITAYDARGRVLERIDPMAEATQPQGPDDDQGH
jgi:YD repeat-containing protein